MQVLELRSIKSTTRQHGLTLTAICVLWLQVSPLRIATVLFAAAPSLLGLPVVRKHGKDMLAEELQQQPAIRLSESFSSLN